MTCFRPFRLVCALGVVLLLLGGHGSSVRAQGAGDALFYAERPPAASTRLMGMAGASTAGVGDIGAFYSNPAGLGLAESSMVTGSFRGLYATDRSSYETFFGSPSDPQSFGTNSTTGTRTGYGLGNLGLLYSFPTSRGSFVLGAAVNETRLFGRDLEFANRNQLSSVTDFFLPQRGEATVEQFEFGESPALLEGQFRVTDEPNDKEYIVDFDPDGDGVINRPLSLAAFQTFAIDLAPSEFEQSAPLQALLPAVTGGTRFRQVGDVTENGSLREISLGGSVEAAKDVFVGASANIHVGSYELRDVFEEIDDRNENDGTNGTVAFNRLRLTRRLNTDLAGFSARFGVSTQLTSSIRAGLTIETPTWYTITEETSFQLQTVFDDGTADTYGDQSGENAGRTRFEYRLRTPWRFGGGVSVELAPLRVSGDVLVVDWTQMELNEVDGAGNFDVVNDRIEDDFKPVVQTRVGAELDLSPVQLRAGAAYHPAPISFSELSGSSGSSLFFGSGMVNERSRLYLSAGLGYTVGDVQINLAWMQERFEDRTLPYNLANTSYVNEEVRRNQLRIGMTFRF